MKKEKKLVYARGRRTVELPYLLSCILFLLDRRCSILGLRYRWNGVRFDLLIRTSDTMRPVPVEVKYRSDGRPIRPYEVRQFHEEMGKAGVKVDVGGLRGVFITNTRFSRKSIQLCKEYGIVVYPNVPLEFEDLKKEEEERSG